MADAATGYVDILPRTDKFSSALSRELDPKLQAAGSNASNLAGRASTAFAALGVVAVAAIGKGISATQQWAGEVKTLQRVTGQSAEDASRLATAGQELGLSTTTLSSGFGLLAKKIVNGSTNLTKYGIATKDAQGNTLPFNDILGNISDKFLTLKPGIEQAAFAQNVFGRGGEALIPILQQGAAGLAELEGHADEYGTTLTDKDLAAVKALNLAQRQLGEAFKGASIAIGRDFIPILTSVVDGVTSAVKVINLIPQPVLTSSFAFVALAGGAAAAGKVIGFLKGGWLELANTFGVSSKLTQVATDTLDANTSATVINTEAQSSLQVAANSVSSTVSTTSDVIDAGTKAVETSTAATVNDIGAKTAYQTVATATLGTTVLQIKGQQDLFDATLLGTGAVGDAAAAQGVLFDATNLTTAAIERQRAVQELGLVGTPIPAGGTGGAGLFGLANSPLVGAAAVLFGLGKSVQFAKTEFTDFFRVLVEHQDTPANFIGGFNAIGGAMRFLGFAVPQVTDNFAGFSDGVNEVQAGLKDGSVTFDQARDQIGKLAEQYGITNLDVNAFVDNLAKSVGVVDQAAIAAEKHTRALVLQNHAIGDLVRGSSTLGNIFDLMGTKAGDFEQSARTAFRESDQSFRTWATDFKAQATAAWQSFKDQAATALDFSSSMLSALEQTAQEASSKLAGDTKGLSSSALATLRSDAKLTATDILHTFQEATRQTKSFGRDLLEISHRGGAAAKELAASLLASGDVLAAQVIADAPKKLQGQIVSAFGEGQTAADNFASKLTSAIIGPLHDIRDVLIAIAKHWKVDLDFLDHGASDRLRTLNTQIDAISGAHTFSFIQEGQPFVPPKTPPPKKPPVHGASGGIFGLAGGGFVTQAPVFQFGEGRSPTFAGRGAEAVIPLNERGIGILAEALGRAGGKAKDMHITVTVVMDDSGNLQVRKIARDEIDREHDYRARVS